MVKKLQQQNFTEETGGQNALGNQGRCQRCRDDVRTLRLAMAAGGTTILGPNGPTPKQAHFPFDLFAGVRASKTFPRQAAERTALLLLTEIQHSLHHRKILPELAAMTGTAGLLTPSSTTDAALPGGVRNGRSAGRPALTHKDTLPKVRHLGLQ